MKQFITYIATIFTVFSIAGTAPVFAKTLAEPGVKIQETEATYARELKSLLKKHQHEWDEMIEQQMDAVKSAKDDASRTGLTKKHREERKSMEARHREEVMALKEEHQD